MISAEAGLGLEARANDMGGHAPGGGGGPEEKESLKEGGRAAPGLGGLDQAQVGGSKHQAWAGPLGWTVGQAGRGGYQG